LFQLSAYPSLVVDGRAICANVKVKLMHILFGPITAETVPFYIPWSIYIS
jgi:hypothetical protein